jgi:hypothetical protein
MEAGGEQIAAIGIRADQHRLQLDYRFRHDDGEDWQHVVQTLHLVRVPCRYGGERPYFLCPGKLGGNACGRRVTKLYNGGRYFLCRHCYHLTYASQCEDYLMRLRRKARKAVERVDASASTWLDLERPKGMWRRTYDCLRRRAFDLEMQTEDKFEGRCAQLQEQLEEKDGKKNPAGDA